MTKPNSTHIVFVVDRSGSMTAIAKDMVGGFKTFIEEQKKLPGECCVSLITFDSAYEVQYKSKPLAEVGELVLEPRGSTALLDAMGKTIYDVGTMLASMNEEDRPSQVLFIVITDGQENSSREYTSKQVFDMITHQREKYSWEFIYLGANQDAIATASSLGISTTNSVTYDATSRGTEELTSGLVRGVSAYRKSGRSRMENIYNQSMYDSGTPKPATPKSQK